MKTNYICSGLILGALFVSTAGFSQQQEPVLASAVTPTEKAPKDGTVQAEGEEKKEDEKTFTLSGSIDTYARTSFGTMNPYSTSPYAPSTSFSDLKGFGLGMVNLVASYGGEKAGFTADVVFGPRGKAAVFGTASGQAIINQMYAYYKLSDKVTLNLGQFNTFLGYEVISPAVNFHYSTSYLFSWGPFNHTGLRADFDLGGGLVAKLAIMNPTDIVEFNPVNTYTLGAQIGHTSDAGGIWLNFLYGDQDGKLDTNDSPYVLDEDGDPILVGGNPVFVTSKGSLFQADLTTGWNLGEKFYLGVNTSYQTVAAGEQFVAADDIQDSDGDATSFMGVALYPKVTLSESFAIGLRAEYFGVSKGHLSIFGTDSGGDGSVTEFTLTGNYKVGGLTLIPEFRIDQTSEDSFLDADGKATNMMPSLSLAAVYKF
ncbi:outer membrane beta-barrel protein [Fulvivirgaceae bacterium PWU4]|uniref:Outer membrane beta-barrel protein n=1 Tax=Chryseosolibacter histidini TaxID=2782349 RepID=A0AAP2DSX7_9BACT|nr:outer membrane beta-barrel protein [Chryseosolibacter histidini]MBT1700482.1 outer membrane beta-barrel protein [Chryseosolibacter histidini]